MRLGLFLLFLVDVVHDRYQMQINGGDGVLLRAHGQGSLCDADTLGVIFLEVEVVGLDIEGKGPQSRR